MPDPTPIMVGVPIPAWGRDGSIVGVGVVDVDTPPVPGVDVGVAVIVGVGLVVAVAVGVGVTVSPGQTQFVSSLQSGQFYRSVVLPPFWLTSLII